LQDRIAECGLRILLVSWYFPPGNAIGALRSGKLAKYLIEQRHDVRVLTARSATLAQTLPLEISRERIAYAGTIDINRPLQFLQQTYKSVFRRDEGLTTRRRTTVVPRNGAYSLSQRISDFYVNLTNYPDRHVGWMPAALIAGRKLCSSWRPDLIYASGPPFTTLLVGRRIARRLRVPWIAEYRDRWVDDPYGDYPGWLRKRLAALEQRVVSDAAGIVTVSEPWADFYRAKFRKPVATIYNGFDPADFTLDRPVAPRAGADELEIVYTGAIYSGRRDASPLFDAIGRLGGKRHRVRVSFYGSAPHLVQPIAERYGVVDRVAIHPPVPYRESVQIQKNADILLLLQWNDPKEQGNCPGKLFEYLAVLRPILGMGLENGVPATIIREREAGFFSSDPQKIAEQLESWLVQKQRLGEIPFLPTVAREGLSRDVQFRKLERFIGDLLNRSGRHLSETPEMLESNSTMPDI